MTLENRTEAQHNAALQIIAATSISLPAKWSLVRSSFKIASRHSRFRKTPDYIDQCLLGQFGYQLVALDVRDPLIWHMAMR
ncbi:MAG: hypothetical protein CM15mP21_0930 [Hyphomicrobiales bacterium]|nr:MAG: hypothetical protein CM15mP21_0930 [Hyphomicrobiales bacterium]